MTDHKPGDTLLGCGDNICGCIIALGGILALLVFISLFTQCGH